MNLLGIFVALPFIIAAMLKEKSIGGGDIKLTATVGFVAWILERNLWINNRTCLIDIVLYHVKFIKISEKSRWQRIYLCHLLPFRDRFFNHVFYKLGGIYYEFFRNRTVVGGDLYRIITPYLFWYYTII